MSRRSVACAVVVVGFVVGGWTLLPALAAAPEGKVATPADRTESLDIGTKLSQRLDPVKLDNVPAKRAFEWWSRATGVPLMINWEGMAADGINPDMPLTYDLHHVPAVQLLSLFLKQLTTGSDQKLIFTLTPWYLEIQTKNQANKKCVVKLYDVRDLLHEPPQFPAPADFNLQTALQGQQYGQGGGGGQNGGIFGQNGGSQQAAAPQKSLAERAEDLMGLIRDTIEPEVWAEKGGPATIKFFNGRLVVSAPEYVHVQIGSPEPPPAVPGSSRSASASDSGNGRGSAAPTRSNGVASVSRSTSPVSGVAK